MTSPRLGIFAGAAVVIVVALLFSGCLFGGDDPRPSVSRPGSIPTATPPANLPEPILVGEAAGPGVTPSATTGGTTTTYIVKSGDTLFGIAGELNVPAAGQAAWVADVLRFNSLGDGASLRVGQELRVPATTAAAPTPAPGTTAVATPPVGGTVAPTATRAVVTSTPGVAPTTALTPRPTGTVPAGSGGTYTVVSGDFPLAIAEKLNIPAAQQAVWVDQLIALNGINPSALTVGQVLRLP